MPLSLAARVPPRTRSVALRRQRLALSLGGPLFLGVCWAVMSWLRWGEIAYPLDDTYIHLAVAQTLAEHGTWGIRPGEFQSASSSPLWTLLLTFVVWVLPSGALLAAPLVVATGCGMGSMWFASGLLAQRWRGWRLTAMNGVILVGGGVGSACLVGMDSALQIFVCVALIERIDRLLHVGLDRRLFCQITVLFACAGVTRYENLALALLLLATVWWVAMARGASWRRATRVWGPPCTAWLAALLLPLIVFGLVGLANGQYFLPTSVIAKGAETSGPRAGEWWWLPVILPMRATALSACLAMTAWLALRLRGKDPVGACLSLSVALATVAQIAFSNIGEANAHFYRYQSFLLACALLVLLRWAPTPTRAAVAIGVTALVTVTVGARQLALQDRQTGEMQHQQALTAAFIGTLPRSWPVAVNDLGLVALRTQQPVTDLMGLGDAEVAAIRVAGGLTPESVAALARNRDLAVAVLYPHWFEDTLPAWPEVARWCLDVQPTTAAGRCVSIYSPDPARRAELIEAVARFEQTAVVDPVSAEVLR